MTILVDQARWPWRGTVWCHLVSDQDLDELHDFAARLGCRRVGFQGDHYDIDIDTREVALELGATPCDSRELVRRLRAAGLRLRPSSFPKWSIVEQWSDLDDASVVLAAASVSPVLRALADRHLDAATLASATGAVVLAREDSQALMIHGDTGHPSARELPDAGVYVRVDRFGGWAVELVDPPLRAER